MLPDGFISLKATAEIIRRSYDNTRLLAAKGEIPSVRLGGRILVDRSAIESKLRLPSDSIAKKSAK